MPNITKIKAQDEEKTPPSSAQVKSPKKKTEKPKKTDKKPGKIRKIFRIILTPLRLLFRPLAPLGRYIRNSWREIRQVHWPNRKLTWKMTLAVLAYTALFVVIVTLLDVLFNFIFNKLIGA